MPIFHRPTICPLDTFFIKPIGEKWPSPPPRPIHIDFITLTEKIWTGKMEVVLPDDLSGDKLYGGFFSCLTTEPREFYALAPNPEANPYFHRPELFLSLDE